jgi:hypothetical protein
VDGGSPKRRVDGEGVVVAVSNGVPRRQGSSGGRRWWWKAHAASKGRGECEGLSHLAKKAWRRHSPRMVVGGGVGCSAPAIP